VVRLSESATGTDETQALPGDGLRDGIVDALRADLGDQLIATHLIPQTDLWVRVSAQAWALTAAALKAHGFEYFCFLSALDWMPSPYGKGEDDPDAEPAEPKTEIVQGYTGGETRFQVFARVTDIKRHERETHEMFGIGFDGHPDLRNLYLPGEFEGFPLRKDFPLLSRMVKPWPGIVDVEPMPAADEPPDQQSETEGGGS
jgi:NADH-quinone oxidoreductase subunit C